MNAYEELMKEVYIQFSVQENFQDIDKIYFMEQAAAEYIAALRARVEQAERQRDDFKKLVKRSQGFIDYLAEHIDADGREIKLSKDIAAALAAKGAG